MAQLIPHFATISYAFALRFSPEVIEQVFTWILDEVNKAGYLDPNFDPLPYKKLSAKGQCF